MATAEAALERAHEVLFYVGLGEARYRTLGTYSLGMRQMAKLAQALVHDPPVLLLRGVDCHGIRRLQNDQVGILRNCSAYDLSRGDSACR